MNLEQKSKKIQSLCNFVLGIICIIIVAALIWRIQCSISYYDEVLNIYISYLTAVLGKQHLVENGYIFSMGDLFNLPFVYLFNRITGGTEGIVLFIRFVYLGFNLVLAGIFYFIFKEWFDKKILLLFGLIFITFFPGGMYTVSYDTAALFFSLLGGILLLGSEMRGNEKSGLYCYFAGLCHACMVYSYPLMAGVIALLFIGNTIYHVKEDKMKAKELWRYWLPYFLGGMTIVMIFLLYVFYVGWENIIFFQKGYIQSSIGGREIGELTSITKDTAPAIKDTADSSIAVTTSVSKELPFLPFLKRTGTKILELLNYMWIQQKATLGFTIVMLIQWGIGLFKKGKWRLLLIPEIILVAFFLHREITCFGGTTMYAYYFCWAPFLYFYLDKEERKQGRIILLILGLISIASFLAIGFTSVRTDKAHWGLYCGAIGTFLLMLILVKKEQFKGISFTVPVILLLALCNLGMAYIDHFQGADIADCRYRMQKGCFKGIMTWEEDIKYENLKECLEQTDFREGAYIYMTNYNYYAACLDGNLWSLEQNFDLDTEENNLQEDAVVKDEYVHDWWPDVIIVDKKNADSYEKVKSLILEEYYNLVSSEYDYFLYIKE